jgi:tetratricopeptide (TPR) repeat protein
LLASDPARAQETARGNERVGFAASVSPDTVYVGEQVTYSLTVRIPTEIRQRLRRNPEFVPPEPRAMLAYDLPLSREPATAEEIEVHVYRRALFAITPGRYQIPAARLTYSLPQSPSFFSREEERTLRSSGVTFIAIDPPARGRPDNWTGAVGRWNVLARLEAPNARVGDPFVLILRVAGEGNATLLPRPPVEIAWADVVAADERIALDSTPRTFSGSKEFVWLVTPRESGSQVVPALTYVAFDPTAHRYLTHRTEPLRLTVAAGDRVVLPPARTQRAAERPLALRPAMQGPSRSALPDTAWWFWFTLLIPVPWIALRVASAQAAREAKRRDHSIHSTRAAFDAALRAHTGIQLARVTAPSALARALRLEGVTPASAADAEALRDALDAASFAPGVAATSDDALSARAKALIARVALEARKRSALPGLLLALVLAAGCATDRGASEQALIAFAEGRTAYVGAEYPRAQAAFARAAEAAPRDAAVWANLGAAAWQAADTGAAVRGWQRALRLDPTDRATRDALLRVRAPQRSGAARVLPIPPLPLAVLGALCWAAAWLLVLAVPGRSSPAAPKWSLIGLALLLGLSAVWLDDRLAAQDLAVIAAASPLRTLPALGADPGPVPLVGEVVRIVERRGVWVRLELSGARSGWYPVDRTYALARDGRD